jgi:Flp pilus assembly CpaF family ATPase
MLCPIRIQDSSAGPANRVLTFCCDMCPVQQLTKGNISANATCRMRVLRLLPFVDYGASAVFHSETHEYYIPASSFDILKEYAEAISKSTKNIENVGREYPELDKRLHDDPLTAFDLLQRLAKESGSRSLAELSDAMRRTRLYASAKKLQTASSSSRRNDYEILFDMQIKSRGAEQNIKPARPNGVLDCYRVGPFSISISGLVDNPFERLYQAVADVNETLASQVVRFSVARRSSQHARLQLLSFDDVIGREIQAFDRFLSSGFDELNCEERNNLAIYATAQNLDLTKIMPLLLDDDVQEFYLDRPGDAFYLDHARWGRCRTNLIPAESELDRVTTRLRLESRHPLDQRSPSLKTELQTKFFHVRAAVDIPPLAHDGIHLNFRKLRLRLLTLPELVSSGTLTSHAAAFLVLCMTMRINITICGEPASGKTTLANAINLVAPSFWRCVDIEDALESIPIHTWGRHKVTFQVEPFDSLEEKRQTKSNEIVRLLHRSPDWVFLGEIQTAEHSKAMFHALSAGIRGIQTCHASSNEDLLLRWRIHHKISRSCFRDLGLLVHMVRQLADGRIDRRVAQISELDWLSGKPSVVPLFEWKKETGLLEREREDTITPLIQRVGKFQRLTNADIHEAFASYVETLEHLVRERTFAPGSVVSAFDKTYASLHPRATRGPRIDSLTSARRWKPSTVLD